MNHSDSQRTILHVDDDPAQLRLVAQVLTKQGYRVVSEEDPTKVLDLLLKSGARLALVDVDMPRINGLDLLRLIKQQDGGVQVIMLTGVTTMSSVLRSMRWGAEACVFKPIADSHPLLSAVEAAFAKIEAWWTTLDELNRRKSEESSSAAV